MANVDYTEQELQDLQAQIQDIGNAAKRSQHADTGQFRLALTFAAALRGDMRQQKADRGTPKGGGSFGVYGGGELKGLTVFSIGATEYYYDDLIPHINLFKELSRNFTKVLEADEIELQRLRIAQRYFVMLYAKARPVTPTFRELDMDDVDFLDFD